MTVRIEDAIQESRYLEAQGLNALALEKLRAVLADVHRYLKRKRVKP